MDNKKLVDLMRTEVETALENSKYCADTEVSIESHIDSLRDAGNTQGLALCAKDILKDNLKVRAVLGEILVTLTQSARIEHGKRKTEPLQIYIEGLFLQGCKRPEEFALKLDESNLFNDCEYLKNLRKLAGVNPNDRHCNFYEITASSAQKGNKAKIKFRQDLSRWKKEVKIPSDPELMVKAIKPDIP